MFKISDSLEKVRGGGLVVCWCENDGELSNLITGIVSKLWLNFNNFKQFFKQHQIRNSIELENELYCQNHRSNSLNRCK